MLAERSIVGGSVFLTKSIPADSRVAMKPPELSMVQKKPRGAHDPEAGQDQEPGNLIDFEI